jgi:hypothetical protein
MDHVAGLQIASGGDGGSAYGYRPDFRAFFLNSGAALAANRARDPASELQVIVGRVHNSIGIHLRKIALQYFDMVCEFHFSAPTAQGTILFTAVGVSQVL